MSVCLECLKHHKWRNCELLAITWLSVSDIVFCSHQVMWLIEAILPVENWPPGPLGRTTVKSGFTSHAPYESIAQVKAEIALRLAATGDAGQALVAEVQSDRYPILSPPAQRALHYVSGWKRKRVSYKTWLWEREHRRIHSDPSERETR